jgi:diacylglycerol kinase
MLNPKSFYFAFKGIADLFSGRHPNAIVHLLAVVTVCIAGYFFKISSFEWLVIVLCFMAVITLEAVNSAIEYVVDLVSPDYHPLAEKAKDMAAGAVLLAALGSIIIAAIVFLPKIISCVL